MNLLSNFKYRFLLLIFMTGTATALLSQPPQTQDTLAQSMARGKNIYLVNCLNCHMENGQGIHGVFPPLAKADYMMADKARSIREMLFGLEGKIVVNGVTYNTPMNPMYLSDQETADVLNYVRNSWGNKGEVVTAKEVQVIRSKGQ